MNLHAICLPHHPSSVIYSSYHTLLGKLRNCSRFIINHVLIAIPPTDDAKHSNYYQTIFLPCLWQILNSIYYIMILFKQFDWLSCCHLTFRKIWYCLIKTRIDLVSLSFSWGLHYVWRHNEVINFILTWFHFHFSF